MGMQPIWGTKQKKFPLLGIEIYSRVIFFLLFCPPDCCTPTDACKGSVAECKFFGAIKGNKEETNKCYLFDCFCKFYSTINERVSEWVSAMAFSQISIIYPWNFISDLSGYWLYVKGVLMFTKIRISAFWTLTLSQWSLPLCLFCCAFSHPSRRSGRSNHLTKAGYTLFGQRTWKYGKKRESNQVNVLLSI